MQTNELIKQKRLEKNMSQNELARELGYITPQLVSNAERNLCGFPKTKVKKICKVLGITKRDFMDAYLSDQKKKIESYFKN